MRELFTFGANADFLVLLNRHDVQYLVVGSLAVQYHCPEREADDLDLVVNRTQENGWKLIAALEHAIKDAACLIDPKTANHLDELRNLCKSKGKEQCVNPVIRNLYLDIWLGAADFDFDSAFRNSIEVRVNGESARVMSCRDLLEHKKSRNREKDQDDVLRLRKVCDVQTP